MTGVAKLIRNIRNQDMFDMWESFGATGLKVVGVEDWTRKYVGGREGHVVPPCAGLTCPPSNAEGTAGQLSHGSVKTPFAEIIA
jgi:hypothetical protein